jgi:hypothetical protein
MHTVALRLVPKHSTHTDAPWPERQLQHPKVLLPRRIGVMKKMGDAIEMMRIKAPREVFQGTP